MKLNTGINEDKRKAIGDGLEGVLAETYSLYLKTHKYHWNVTGPMFQSLHAMFEEHYTELATAVDEIAERIRVLGRVAPGSFQEFAEISRVKDDPSKDVTATKMIETLLADHEQVVRTCKEALATTEDANDPGTEGLLGARIEYHEKIAWMLKSLTV